MRIGDIDATDLLNRLGYLTSPGEHTYGPGGCGHPARGCADWCAWCIDEELMRRGVDAARLQPMRYTRDATGQLERKETRP